MSTHRTVRPRPRPSVLGGTLAAICLAAVPLDADAMAAPPVAGSAAASSAIPLERLEARIRLRGIARIAPGVTDVRLRDVARISGDATDRIADLVVTTLVDDATGARVTPSEIRDVLAEAGAHPGLVLVTGPPVDVRPGGVRPSVRPPAAMTTMRIGNGRATVGSAAGDVSVELVPIPAVDAITGRDVMSVVTHRFLTGLKVAPERLRLRINPRDVATLARADRTSDVTFIDTPADSAVRIRIAERRRTRSGAGGLAEPDRIVVIRPELHVESATLRQGVLRNTKLTASILEAKHDWMAPADAALAVDVATAVGQSASRQLTEGRVLLPEDMRLPWVVNRGDTLVVRDTLNGYQLQIQVEARDRGRVGDRIRVARDSDGLAFEAIVIGEGVVRPLVPGRD